MTGAFAGRDGLEVDALVTDRYLEALLRAHARGTDNGPTTVPPADPIRSTADRLARDLPRLHPSFLFEEALASRLAEVAARMWLPADAGAPAFIVSLPRRAAADDDEPVEDDEPADDDQPAGGRPWFGGPWFGRPLLIGGALTSAALSLAGAAYVAWRLNRPPGGPMVRAVRAVARTRPV